MKIKKETKRYCPICKKSTTQTVSAAKKRERGSLKFGSRLRKRGSNRGIGNQGRFSRKAISAWKRTGSKVSKKTDLRYKCKECGKSNMQKSGIRSKKVEFV